MVLLNENGEIFRFYKIYLRVFGVWPLDRHDRRSKTVFCITLLAQMMTLIMYLTHPLDECVRDDELQAAQRLRVGFTILGVVHQICLRIHGSQMAPLIEAIIQDWSSIKDPRVRDIMKHHDKSGSLAFYAQGICFFVAIPIWQSSTLPFIRKISPADKRPNCLLNDDFFSRHVIPVICLIAYWGFKLISVGGNMLFWTFATHLSGQYKILKEQFQRFMTIRAPTLRRREFRRLVQKHNRLLDLTGILEDSFTVFVAIHLFYLLVSYCLIAFKIITNAEDLQTLIQIMRCWTMVNMATIIFMYYHVIDYLNTRSEQVGQAFTECKWYDLSKESIKNFSIVVARCQRPKSVTALKIFKLNHSNLKHVVNGLYSYGSCVAAVIKDKAL